VTIRNEAQRALRMDCARRIAAYARNGQTDVSPSVEMTDVSFFTDPQLYELEHRKLFQETPLVVCFSKDLPEPDSFRVFDEAGVPIVVTRGKDGEVRAFLNICAHRGARVVREPCGKASRFTCRFHGWTFDGAGKTIGVPLEREFCGMIGAQKQLVTIPAEERHGLVFVQATPGSTMDLDAHLAGFGEQLAPLDLDQAELVYEDELRITSNWKLTLDTYFENYHLPVLHRDTLAKVFAHNLNIFETWGPHHRFTWPQQSIYDWKDKPEEEWPIWVLPLTHFLFPNMHMAVGATSATGGYIAVHRLFPQAVGELVTKISVYAPYGVESEEQRADLERSFALAKKAVETEDYSVTAEAWPMFSALPAGTKFPVGRHEIGVQNFHRNVRKFAYGEREEETTAIAVAAE
jgi:phenylpropionate dioxygenase-like ring-hydroxylating dioxygenase large terminal subunit